VVVRKRERTLRARCEGGGERSWTIALGREPLGPKRLAGDLRTPEGDYHLMQRSTSRFHRFVWIDYPSPADADAALTSALISYSTHAAILEARRQGRLPPQDTALGGQLGLHGEGRRWRGDSQHLDWTSGCIAMSDAQIDFLIERAPPGTPLSIEP
jgi:murein L,D-transpeptidase YafK